MKGGFFAWAVALGLAVLSGCAEVPVSTAPAGPAAVIPGAMKTDAQITNVLVDLLEHQDQATVDLSKAEGAPVGEILKVGSPIGYSLRNRYLNIGIPLAEALSRNQDPVFRGQLVNLARWDRNGETRAAALVALARAQDLRDYDVFREALVHLDPAVRFGALEALQAWGHPEKSLPLLGAVAEREVEPILRVYASAALARLGDSAGLNRLRAFLDDGSWLVRAMAGRYLGDFGAGGDYDRLVARIGREAGNDFVVAEYCIAALKLFPKKGS
ncbi:MAG: HEAT repeat domain-containing protein [Elusimicrobia bacterium]|nr:HEAT repeat domain-containing protein [Elusimicrobiota bacterium]